MAEKLLSITQLRERVPMAPSRIYELLLGEQFPLPIKIGRRNFWREAEIDEWVADLAKQRDAAAPAAKHMPLIPTNRRIDDEGARPKRRREPSVPRPLSLKEVTKIKGAAGAA